MSLYDFVELIMISLIVSTLGSDLLVKAYPTALSSPHISFWLLRSIGFPENCNRERCASASLYDFVELIMISLIVSPLGSDLLVKADPMALSARLNSFWLLRSIGFPENCNREKVCFDVTL